jgi:lysylphosphatidylglycerol synthetase-like protein (DUF2156 family)
MRAWFSLAALVLSVIAAVVSLLDDKSLELGFFAITAILAAMQAWCVREPYEGVPKRLGMGIALVWVIGAIWIGVLLLMYQSASRPPPSPEETYLGLTATVYHLVAVYGGALAVAIAAFAPLARRRR